MYKKWLCKLRKTYKKETSSKIAQKKNWKVKQKQQQQQQQQQHQDEC